MPGVEKYVSKADDGTWTFQCPRPVDDPCGPTDGDVGFRSTQWPTRKLAEARGQQHIDEHKGEGPMPPLHEFHAEHGLVPTPDGSVMKVEDL